jgi:hypothetical protein
MIEYTGKAAAEVAKGLAAGGPLALPLVIINVVCLGVVFFTLYHISNASERRDSLIAELAKSCQPIVERMK